MKEFLKKYWIVLTALITLAGGTGVILQAEDRWNQKDEVIITNHALQHLEKDVIAGFQQMQQQQSLGYCESRLQNLYDQLRSAQYDLSKDPHNQTIKDRINWLDREIRDTKTKIENLKLKISTGS